MQQNLFGLPDEKPQQKKGLAIIKQGKQVLTRQQKDFNRLVKKIEQLRANAEKITRKLDNDLKYYAEQIHPLEARMTELKLSGAKVFYRFYTVDKKSLSKGERKTLKEIMAATLDEVLFLIPGEPDDELKEMYKTVNDESYEDSKKNAFEEMKQEMQDQFRDSGLDIDLDDIDETMTEEELAIKMKEMQDAFMAQAEQMEEKDNNRKKTKKQQEQEAREKQMEEARKKSMGTIYKQLAKAFHPDLETDPELKLQKEDIMKQLTVAYENSDLHALLKLEIELMEKENNDPGKLTNDKLAIYNEVLKEQVMELEMQLEMAIIHPRYQSLHRFVDDPSDLPDINLGSERKELEADIRALEKDVPILNGPNALKRVKEIILGYREDDKMQNDMDKILQEFLRGAMR